MPRFNDGVVNTKIEKGDIVLMGNPNEYGEILAENLLVEDITRANLQTLISGSNLVRGKGYRITNAVGSTLSLLVQALTANTIAEYAYNTANGETYKYDITADTAVLEPNPIALGTANQLLGINAGATEQEYKTLSSEDTTIEITHTTNGIDLKKKQAISVTKAELDALVSGSLLIPYQDYLLTDATSQNISLLLTAKDNNELFTQCQIITDNFDIMEYDYTTDTFKGIDNLNSVIRCTADVWAYLNDSDHKPRNFSTISQNNTTNSVTVVYRRNDYNKVLSINVTPDETFVLNGVNCGASVGLTGTIILYQKTFFNYAYVDYSGGVWRVIDSVGITGASFNAGDLTITHAGFGGDSILGINPRNSTYNCHIKTLDGSNTVVQFIDWNGNVITTPDTNMKVWFSRGVARQLLNTEADISGSNIWITGQMMKEIA